MENVCLRLDSALSKQIEKDMKEFRYSTKTEFIREAIRSKLKELEEERKRNEGWKALVAARGIFKGKGKAKTYEEWHKLRIEAGEKFMKELEVRFSKK